MKTKAKVAVLKTSPSTILDDYYTLMRLVDYEVAVPAANETLLKLNLSWTKYFPACSSPPWQLEAVVKTLLKDGYPKERLLPVENKTVVTDPRKGAKKNRWSAVMAEYGLTFTALPEVEWVHYQFRSKLFRLNQIFPDGIEIPKMFIGKNIIHLPTLKTHGHSITTGAVKNSFGGLLKEIRHYAHKYIHEVLADLMLMQRELHPGIFAVMDATVCGDGAGPRTMVPKIKNYILASSDCVAIDAIAAKLMGFNPLEIPYLKICHQLQLGVADPEKIEVVGEDISNVNFGFRTRKSLVIWGDQLLRRGALRFLEKPALHSSLAAWAPLASNLYHDFFWYPIIGKSRIRKFMQSEWGRLLQTYR
ncbi:DUF362 domain-containing protein [candidate division KSB1 bacterium]|nr:DUF362 domain-containing protein [candidate division KSB1 bacterium]